MLTSDQRLADAAARICDSFAAPEEIAQNLGEVMQTLVVCILHLCHRKGYDPYEFMRDATQQFYETMVVDAKSN